MNNAAARYAGLSKVLTAFVVLALLAAVFLLFTNDAREKTVVADFKVANSLYKGNDVRVMGVQVGEVTKIEPQGDHVRVTMAYDSSVKLPADAKAVMISPSIVGDRFIQLGPSYSGGPTLPDNARLGIDRTAVPVELDDIFKSIDNLALALGPEGANKDGALAKLVDSTANQLEGQGEQLATTLENFAKLSTTLDNNDEQLFSSVREIDEFVALLRRNDDDVRDFFDSTADVAEVLADERDDLADTIEALQEALVEVQKFVRENRTALRGNVDNLERLAALLANRSDQIDHLLTEAPIALADLGLAGGGTTATLDARADLVAILTAAGIPGLLQGLIGNLLNIPGLLPALLAQLTDIFSTFPTAASLPTQVAATGPAAAGGTAAAGVTAKPQQSSPGLLPGGDDLLDSLLGGIGGVN